MYEFLRDQGLVADGVIVTTECTHSQRRLGELTRLLRRRAGLSRRWVAEQAKTERSVVRALERGKPVDPLVATRLMAVIEQELDQRRTEHSETSKLVAGQQLHVAEQSRSLPEGNDPEVVLRMYLDLVCAVRGLRGRASMHLRSGDIDELSEVLHMPAAEVAAQLVGLMATSMKRVRV